MYARLAGTYIPAGAKGTGGAGLMIAIASAIIGIIFAVTCKQRPIKWVEYSISIISIIIFLIAISQNTKFYGDLVAFQWGFFILVCLGLPFRKGFKGMPFKTRDESEPAPEQEAVASNSNSSNDSSNIEKLRDLKKLLDDGIITQEDFDKKKKELLKL